jgi:hypothetical protein
MQGLYFASLVLLGAVAVAPNVQPARPTLDPRLSTVLPAEKSLAVLRQCSRLTPSYRLIVQAPRPAAPPTQDEIAEVEAGLSTLLADRLEAFRESYPDDARAGRVPQIERYYRQYSSLELGPWRVIYVNGFYNELLPRSDQRELSDWRQAPAMMCDGGEYYFGVEYYPAAKMFANFSYNGRYEGRLRLVR